MYDKYRKAKLDSESTGFGLTEDDRKNGITSVEEKLDNMCPLFSRMNDLFSTRPNVIATSTSETGGLDTDEEEPFPKPPTEQQVFSRDEQIDRDLDNFLKSIGNPVQPRSALSSLTIPRPLMVSSPSSHTDHLNSIRIPVQPSPAFSSVPISSPLPHPDVPLPSRSNVRKTRMSINQAFLEAEFSKLKLQGKRLHFEREEAAQKRMREDTKFQWEKEAKEKQLDFDKQIKEQQAKSTEVAARAEIVKKALDQGRSSEDIERLLELVFKE